MRGWRKCVSIVEHHHRCSIAWDAPWNRHNTSSIWNNRPMGRDRLGLWGLSASGLGPLTRSYFHRLFRFPPFKFQLCCCQGSEHPFVELECPLCLCLKCPDPGTMSASGSASRATWVGVDPSGSRAFFNIQSGAAHPRRCHRSGGPGDTGGVRSRT